MKDLTCNNCYFNDQAMRDELEPGEKCFCKKQDAFVYHECSEWISETSPELGEDSLFEQAGGIYVTGQIFETAEYQRELDDFLDKLRREGTI